MCLMCEEDAFFRAYWEQVLAARARQGESVGQDASRFSAIPVAEAGATDAVAPEAAAPDASRKA
jgi:hypothetical protein